MLMLAQKDKVRLTVEIGLGEYNIISFFNTLISSMSRVGIYI